MKEILGTKSSKLKGKLIVLCVCGSVAGVKSFELARELIRHGAKVQPVMSRAALELVGEKLLEFACGQKVITEITGQVEHVKFFGKKPVADLLLIAPATANTISKIAMGIDDTPITTFATTAIGSKKPVLIAPAMHEPMYGHPIVKENLAKLEQMGAVKIIGPLLSEEKAKLSPVNEIVLQVLRALCPQTLFGKKILIASGATAEEIDDVRVLSGRASGKTGAELAREAFRRGAQVTLVQSGGMGVETAIKQTIAGSSKEMLLAVLKELQTGYDCFFCPAAISDFSVKKTAGKISSEKKFLLELLPQKKLLQSVREKHPELFIVGFKALAGVLEKELEKSALELLKKHSLQAVVANDVQKNPPGGDTNSILIVSAKKTLKASGKKTNLAEKIIDFAQEQMT